MRKSLLYLALCSFIFASSCGSDDGDDGGGNTNVDIGVTAVEAADVENRGNASDIRVSFTVSSNEGSVDHYRIFVVKASARNGFDLPTAEAVPESSYAMVTKTGSDIVTFLSVNTLDADGEAIVEARNYVIFVMSVGVEGVDNVLRPANFQLALAKTDILSILEELPIGTGGLLVDDQGNIYCADFGTALGGGTPGSLLYKVTPGGQASIFASGFTGASGNTFGPDGSIYQSNTAGRISKVTMDGTVSTYATVPNPIGVVFDDDGNLYAASCGRNAIYKIAPNRSVSVFASSPLLSCPNGLTIDTNGNLYTSNFSDPNVVKITPDGTATVLTGLPGGNNGHITFHKGDLYVVARAAHRIYKVTLSGQATVLVGSGNRGHNTGAALQSELSLPNDLGFSPDGTILYINDTKPLTGTQATSPLTPTFLKKVRLEKD